MITVVTFKNNLLVSFVGRDTDKFADFQKSSMEDLQKELGKNLAKKYKVAYLGFSAFWIVQDYKQEDLIKYLQTKYPSRSIRFYDKPKQVIKLIGLNNLRRVKYYLAHLDEEGKENLLISRRFKVAGLSKEDLERTEKELALKYKAALTESEKATIKNNWLKVKAELLNFEEII